MIDDTTDVNIEEHMVLEKFDGDAHPDNLIERVYLHNGEIIRHEFISDGEVVKTLDMIGGNDAAN